MQCDIIIPVWNQLEVTKDCVDSILRHTKYPYRLIIIDNGSDKETADYLRGLKGRLGLNLTLIRNETNLGFVKAVNQGIGVSDSPYLCIMNNDTVATEGWLEEMVYVMEANLKIGLLNPSSNTSGQFPQNEPIDPSAKAQGQSRACRGIDDYASGLKEFHGQIQELYTCRGFCMLLRKEVIEKLGPLDEIYHFGYFDDTDYCKRAQGAGYRTARAKGAYIYHRENVSFKKLDDNKALFENNEKIFFKRWGRPVRVGYFIDRAGREERIDEIATDTARNGHQINIFIKKGLRWPVRLDHFDIRRIDLNPVFFGIIAIYKIFKRKNKKKLDILLTDDRIFGTFLKALKGLHCSEVLINADRQSLQNTLTAKSRGF